MSQSQISDYRALKQAGWIVSGMSSEVCFNGGSESLRHFVGKSVAGYVCRETGYTVLSEVTVDDAVCDILAFGHQSRNPIVVEIETDKTEAVESAKLDSFAVGPVRDVFVIESKNLPPEMDEMRRYIKGVLGL